MGERCTDEGRSAAEARPVNGTRLVALVLWTAFALGLGCAPAETAKTVLDESRDPNPVSGPRGEHPNVKSGPQCSVGEVPAAIPGSRALTCRRPCETDLDCPEGFFCNCGPGRANCATVVSHEPESVSSRKSSARNLKGLLSLGFKSYRPGSRRSR